jgi:hypothetical protein
MKTRMYLTVPALVLAILLLPASFAMAQGLNNNEVEFDGTISSVVVKGEGNGTLFVHLDTFVQRVLVSSKTALKDTAGEPITLDALAEQIGKDVEVTGKFSSSGVLATQVRLLEGEATDTFTLRGHITQMGVSGPDTIITLLGISVLIDAGTTIEADGATASPSDLKPGTKIQVEGTISGTEWKATTINILTGVFKRGNLRFEGVVETWDKDSGLLEVAVTGAPGNVTQVHVTAETKVSGDLEPDAYVLVVGVLESDLSVTAKEVRVLSALEIKPDERKLKVGSTATFTVKLRESAASAVTVDLTVAPSGIVSLPVSQVTIAQGARTAEFSVTAEAIGTASVKATALGSDATALVKVGEVSDDEQEPAQGEVRIAFAPDHIKLEPNATREVVLLVSPPQTDPLAIQPVPSSALVTIVTTTPLGPGSSLMKVTVQAGSGTGSTTLIATLPTELGGGQAELLVEVAPKGGGNK